jgi:hypothetical protein
VATSTPSAAPSYLESALFTREGFRHAFFTRRAPAEAGHPELDFASPGESGDALLEASLAVAARVLGVAPQRVYYLTQTHGTVAHVVTGDEPRPVVRAQAGDVVVTRSREAAAAIRTADCVPVLLACRETGWVAASHAGWRGCALGVVPATVERLRELGARALIAAVGPHISVESFEVSLEVAEQLRRASPDPEIVVPREPRPHVDLRRMVRAQLRAAGLAPEAIDDVHGCSLRDAALFHSHRRDGERAGRMLSAIVGRP